jgi:PTS system ascorbate-specific IIB component
MAALPEWPQWGVVERVKILAVCGMGLGSGLLLRMQAEKALKQLGLEADLEVADIGSARALAQTADLVLTSTELAQQLGDVKAQVVTITNFVDLDEMVQKLGAALERDA